jgi:nodulation protein E
VIRILAEQAVLEPGDVRPDMTLEDLGIDSLGLVETVFAIEEAFDIQVPFNANAPHESDLRHRHRRQHRAGGRRRSSRSGPERVRRVVITGQGASARSDGCRRRMPRRCARGGAASGRSISATSSGSPIAVGGQVRGYLAEAHFTRQELTLYDRFTQFALLAAREAMESSGLEITEALAERGRRRARHLGRRAADPGGELPAGLRGGQEPGASLRRAAADEQRRREPRLDGPQPPGPGFTVATACASSNHAMGQAFHLIRGGVTRVMLTGGSESMLCFGGIKAWEGLRVMSRDVCRPFSRNRTGMIQGEGAAVFVFEEYEHARARGADILAEVVGFAMTSDASDIVMPNRKGAVRAMRGALRDAGLPPEAIGYINAHGTGTTANDRTECAAVREAFGAHADRLMISSTKSMHGHVIGGTGAIELLACILALREGVVPPTINHEIPDPDCDLDVVPNVAREARVEVAMSNAFAFGGLNACLVLRAI